MRRLRVKEGVREARQVLSDAGKLMKGNLAATLELGLVLALLPALLRAFFAIRTHGALLGVWEGWANALMGTGTTPDSLTTMAAMTMRQSGTMSLASSLMDLASSLVLTPLLLSSLALLFNNFVTAGEHPALSAAQGAGRNVRNLIFVSLACMLAEWFVQMVPSLASSVLSLLAGMLAWIPILGPIANVLAVILSVLISLLTDFAVVVIFSYVWICAACEGVPGFGALVRSWQLTRNAMHETISSLLAVTLLRWLTVLVLGVLWWFGGRALGMPLSGFMYVVYGVGALFSVLLGATTSALYQRRPTPGSPQPGQFRSNGPDINNMKSANID